MWVGERMMTCRGKVGIRYLRFMTLGEIRSIVWGKAVGAPERCIKPNVKVVEGWCGKVTVGNR
jgi:hypothetical protein